MTRNLVLSRASALLIAAAVTGCSLATEPPPAGTKDMAMSHPAGGSGGSGGGGGAGGAGGAGGIGGTGGSGGGGMPDMTTVVHGMLPFSVDSQFVSSGFMGDGSMAGPITVLPAKPGDSTDCNGMRSKPTAAGNCHIITYMPPATGSMGWGGVYWQYPANNWGAKAGFGIPPGATKVIFQAKGAKGGEKVTFLAGGIIGAGMAHTDSLKATTTATLTNAWATYSIDLSGQSYTQVLGGFGWTMTATDAGATGSFSVDDIQWQ
jgi:hypothetical protein